MGQIRYGISTKNFKGKSQKTAKRGSDQAIEKLKNI